MRKYGGSVIHQQHSSDGILEIVQANGVRSMHFGTSSRQSCFLVADPERLHLSYVRAMSLGLVFCPQAQNVLMVGLGGGSLTQFLLNHYAACAMTVIEKRRDVANVSYQYFNLPRNDRMKLLIGDGGVFIDQQARSNRTTFDLLVIDAFTSDAIPTHLLTKEAIELYLSRLNRNGLLVFHISNRYLAINKVLSDHAEKLGLSLLIKEFRSKQKTPLLSNSDWVILARNPAQLEPMLTTNWRGDWHKLPHYPNVRSWTDDFTSIMTVWK